MLAGLLFTTTATTAGGTDLRNDRRPDLTGLIAERKRQVAEDEGRAAKLRHDIEQQTDNLAGSDARIADQRARAEAGPGAAGPVAMHGPGLTVRLNDAPGRAAGTLPGYGAGALVGDPSVRARQ